MPAASRARPVTTNPSPEAAELLDFLRGISGKKTLAGQHCAPLHGSTRLVVVQRQTGTYPALFGQDFGFDGPGCWDGINFRQNIVDEAIRRYHEGFIITLMWHAVRPIEEEPVAFETGVQGKVTDAQWQDLITAGTRIHERWKSQVDVIAWFLRQMRDAGVPVLWRPYHEMNGDWFWWGKRSGNDGYKKLYRMLFERLTHFHELNNLLWVYNANEINVNVDPYADFYPGHDVVDVLATDVYRRGFAEKDYMTLAALAGDKPIALGEVGKAPAPELIETQPRWAWFMMWNDTSALPSEELAAFQSAYASPRVMTLGDLPWNAERRRGAPRMHYPLIK